MRNLVSFKKFMMVLGFLAMLGAGYVATSVVTCRPAQAATCRCSFCVYMSGGIILALSDQYIPLIQSGISTAQSTIFDYYDFVLTDFAETILGYIDEKTQNFVDWWDTFWDYALFPALHLMTNQLVTMDTDQARQVSAFTDAAEHNRTLRKQREEEVKTQQEMRPGENICQVATITGGMSRVQGIRAAFNAAAPLEALPRTGNRQGTPAASGHGTDQSVRYKNYCNNYADTLDNAGDVGCAAGGTWPNADLDVTGKIFTKNTVPIDSASDPTGVNKKIIDDIITNIAEPFAIDPILPGAVSSSAGLQRALETQAYKAKRQVIYDALYFPVSRRVPGSQMGNFIKEMRESSGIPLSEISANPSHNEVMETMMAERFRTGEYSIQGIDEPENNEREMIVQQAFQLMQMSDELDLLDRYSLVLAAEASAQTKAAKPFSTESESTPKK